MTFFCCEQGSCLCFAREWSSGRGTPGARPHQGTQRGSLAGLQACCLTAPQHLGAEPHSAWAPALAPGSSRPPMTTVHSAASPDLTGGLLRQVHVPGVWGRQVGPLASKGVRPLAELGFQSSVELSAASPVVNPSRFSGPCKAPPHPNSDGFTVGRCKVISSLSPNCDAVWLCRLHRLPGLTSENRRHPLGGATFLFV